MKHFTLTRLLLAAIVALLVAIPYIGHLAFYYGRQTVSGDCARPLHWREAQAFFDWHQLRERQCLLYPPCKEPS